MFYLRFIENCAQRKLWTFKSRLLSAVIRFVIIPGPLDQFVQKLVALQPTDVCTDSFFFFFFPPRVKWRVTAGNRTQPRLATRWLSIRAGRCHCLWDRRRPLWGQTIKYGGDLRRLQKWRDGAGRRRREVKKQSGEPQSAKRGFISSKPKVIVERQTKSLLRCLCLASSPQAKAARCKGHRSSVFDRNALFSAVILMIFCADQSKFWVCKTASRLDYLKTLNIQHLFDLNLKQIWSSHKEFWSVV